MPNAKLPALPARLFATSILAAALSACGGGSSSSNPEPPASSSESSSVSQSSEGSSQSSSSASSEPDYFAVAADYHLYDEAPTDFPVGVAISAADEPYSIFHNGDTHDDAAERRELVAKHFNQLTAGNIMKMSYLQPSEDNFTFEDADELVDFAQGNGMTVHGHALVWHPDYQVPEFMKNYEGDDWEAMLTHHVTEVVTHFDSDVVVSWDVVNEAVADDQRGDGWRQSLFYNFAPPAEGEVPQYIEVAFQAARDANADIDLYYNDYDNTANPKRREKTLEIAKHLKGLDIIDGVGFQMHAYMDYPSISDFRDAFQEVVDLGLKVKLTEIDVAVINPYGGGAVPDTLTYDEELAGAQKQRYCEIAEVYLETVPAEQRGGFTVWGLTDDESWLMNQFANATGHEFDDVWPLLFNADLSTKPALEGVAEAFRGNACSSEFDALNAE